MVQSGKGQAGKSSRRFRMRCNRFRRSGDIGINQSFEVNFRLPCSPCVRENLGCACNGGLPKSLWGCVLSGSQWRSRDLDPDPA